MKTALMMLGCLSLGACATTTQYENRVDSWEGKDSSTLVKTWGQPDATEKMANGDRILLYTRLKHEPYSFAESDRVIATKTATTRKTASADGDNLYVKCSTYFSVNKENKISFVEYRGDDCKWKN